MAKEILYKGISYPLQFNMLVFRDWEIETGLKISDFSTLANGGVVEVINALTLLYFAIKDACEEKEIEFKVTLKNFIRSIDMTDEEEMKKMMSLITLSDGLENKRQPMKLKKTVAE